jgi:hypothetical protein
MARTFTKVAVAIVFATSLAGLPCIAAQASSQPVPAHMQPQVTFEYQLDEQGQIQHILVERDRQQIQALDSCTGQDIPRENGLGELAREDFNFDGYPDLMMRSAFDPQTDNSSYCIWLYDLQTQKFALSPELSRLINPQPDPDNKTIVSRENERCSDQCYTQDTYAWSNEHLKLIREESLTEDPMVPPWSDCRWVWELKKEKGGKLVEINRERVDVGGVMCEPHTAF